MKSIEWARNLDERFLANDVKLEDKVVGEQGMFPMKEDANLNLKEWKEHGPPKKKFVEGYGKQREQDLLNQIRMGSEKEQKVILYS